MVIAIEPNLTEEQLIKNNPELFMECKLWWRCCKDEVFHDEQNSHLRKASRIVGD